MAVNESDMQASLQPRHNVKPEELRAFARRIKESGELGRSQVYRTLLDYLVDCSITHKNPKEIEIAIDALGKNSDFDVSNDSAVRVYIHQLRKKLDNYYQSHEANSRFRLVIPKGQYTVAVVANSPATKSGISPRNRFQKAGFNNGLIAILILILTANLLLILNQNNIDQASQNSPITGSRIWHGLLDDDLPVLLVMGDYYIFGELNENGNIGRMVREFNINSKQDLDEQHFSDWESTRNYQDLDLSYMPEGSAYALSRIIPLLSSGGKRINITMMSDLTTADMRSNHIIYIGYISALDKLTDIVFAASGLQVGRSYDELINTESGQYYTSDAGLPEEGQHFRDFGFFSTFPASNENQVLVIGGMRDAGLMQTAQALSDDILVSELEREIILENPDGDVSLEVLYEVFGIDRMNFDSRLVYSRNLDASLIWGRSLSSLTD